MRKLNSKLYYSVLKYIPNVIRMESINVGIAIHCPAKKFSHFYETKNKPRLKAFDDEYNPTFFRMVMSSLKYELNFGDINVDTLNLEFNDEQKRFSDITNEEFLNNRISYLANEFRFTPVQSMIAEDIIKDVEDLKDMYLFYDKPKNNRITRKQVQRLLNKQMQSYNLSNVRKSPTFKDIFGGQIKFDYSVNNNTLLRAITFDYQDQSKLINELKLTLYNLENTDYSDVSKIFLVRNDNLKESTNKEIYNKFKKQLKDINKNKQILVFPLSELEQTLNKELA